MLDLNKQESSETPLYYALALAFKAQLDGGRIESKKAEIIIKLLLDAGADPRVKMKNATRVFEGLASGCDLEDLAVAYDLPKAIIKMILAKVNEPNEADAKKRAARKR